MVCTFAASEPASGSVSANAASLRPATRSGSQRRLLLRGPEQQQGPHADRMMRVDEDRRRAATRTQLFQDTAVGELRKTASAHGLRRRHAQDAQPRQAVDHRPRDVGPAVNFGRVKMLVAERFELPNRRGNPRPLLLRQSRIGQDQVRRQPAPEELFGDALPPRSGEEQVFGLTDLLLLTVLVGVHRGGGAHRTAPGSIPPSLLFYATRPVR